ncbi:putative PD-(D/E)XK nuclease family protein [Gammaproteobacteria bacterium]
MEITLSNSGITQFRRCPRKYYWKYVRKLEPIRPSKAIVLGDFVHSAFAHYYQKSQDREETLEALIGFGTDLVTSAPAEEQEELSILGATACAMWQFVPDWMFDDASTVAAEKYFIWKLLDSKTDAVYIRGYIDRLVEFNGKKLIRELKTCASPDVFIRQAANSSQASTYVIGTQEAINKDVVGVSYDLIRKPQLRKRQNENAQEFVARIREDYRSRPEWYYRREYTYRTRKNLDQFVIDLRHVARDILIKWMCYNEGDGDVFYRNHDACFSCGECEYYKICFNYDEMTEKIFYKPVQAEETRSEADDVEEA